MISCHNQWQKTDWDQGDGVEQRNVATIRADRIPSFLQQRHNPNMVPRLPLVTR